MQKLHFLQVLVVICLVEVALANPTEGASYNGDGSENYASCKDEDNLMAILSRAVVERSNMPEEMQDNAAALLDTAYDVQSTLSERVTSYKDMFTALYPEYHWNVVANYQYIYFYSTYYIRLSHQGDVIFMFGIKSC